MASQGFTLNQLSTAALADTRQTVVWKLSVMKCRRKVFNGVFSSLYFVRLPSTTAFFLFALLVTDRSNYPEAG